MTQTTWQRMVLPGLVAGLSLLLLSACGGGGSSRQGLTPEGTSTDDPPNSGNINGGLTGRILAIYNDRPVQIDLGTGLVSNIPIESVQDWLANNGLNEDTGFSSSRSHFEAGGPSSSLYVQTVPQCFRDEDNLSEYESCVAIYSAGYERLNNIRIKDRELSLAAKLSPSGKYVAFNEYYSRAGVRWSDILLMELAGVSYLDVVGIDVGDIDATGASGDRYVNAGESPLAWTPNDELVYTVPSDDRVVVYITEPGSLTVANTIRLPSSYQGEVVSLDVSPDGTRLLMGYNPSRGVLLGGVLMLDLNTLDVFVPAIVPSEVNQVPLGDNIQGYIRSPRWSPDGRWIMLIEGAGSFAGTAASRPTHLYAVPANKSRTVLTMDEPTEAVVIAVEYPDKPGTLTNSWFGDDYIEPHYDWVN